MSSIYTYNRTKDIHSHKISGKMNKRMRIRTGRDIISSVSQQIFNIDNGSVSIHLSLTLNVRGLNTQIKRFLITDKKDPTLCCLQETHLTVEDTEKESEGWK